MVKKRDEKTQKTLTQYFGSNNNNKSKSSSSSSSRRTTTTTTSNHATKQKSINSKQPSSIIKIILDDEDDINNDDDPIEVDDDDNDDIMKIVTREEEDNIDVLTLKDSTIYPFKPLSSSFDVIKKLPDAPKRLQLSSLAYTPVGCTCVYPYNPHFSHDQVYQHSIRKAQPPTFSQLFYRKLTGIPLSRHVAQVFERKDTQHWFNNKPNELARLVDMSDTQATEYVTCMDVCGNSMVYGTHKGNITMCSFVDRDRYFKHSFIDSRISNARINPYSSTNELSVSTLSTTTGALCLFDMVTGKIKSTALNDSVLDFENNSANTLIISKKNGKLDILDVRSKTINKIPSKTGSSLSTSSSITNSPVRRALPSSSSSSSLSTSNSSTSITNSPLLASRAPPQGVGVLVAKKSTKKKTTIHNTSNAMIYSDPFDCISIDKNDSNYIYASSFHSMDVKIFDLRRSLNDSVVNINVSSSIQDLNNRLERSMITIDLPVQNQSTTLNDYRTETGLHITEVTQLFRGPKQKAMYNSQPSKGIKSFGTTKSGHVHFLTTSGGIGLLDPITKRVSKYYEDIRSFSLGSFGQKGDVIESDNGMFMLAPYGTSIHVMDWSRPKVDEWNTIDNTTIRQNSAEIERTMKLSCKMYAGTCKNNISQVRVLNPHSPDQKIVCSEFDNRLVYFE